MSIDFGPQGGGSQGPYLNWHAREANDGSVPGRSFSIRDRDVPRAPLTLTQVVIDLNTARLGWINSTRTPGTPPQKQWNKSLKKYEPAPGPLKKDGVAGWARGFAIRMAIGGGKAATWEQDAAGAIKGFQNMLMTIPDLDAIITRVENGETLAELPVMEMQPPERIEGKTVTFAPMWKFIGMTARPDCLKAQAVAASAAPAQPAAVPAGTFNTPATPPPAQPEATSRFGAVQF